jgi:hypothetical protein
MGRNRGLFQLSVPMLLAPGIPFDTSNVLFICGGAFVGLEDIIAKRLGRGSFTWLIIARYLLMDGCAE